MTAHRFSALGRVVALAFLLALIALTPSSLSAVDLTESQDLSQPQGLWISLGQDAFDRLQDEPGLSFDHRPLRLVAEKGGVAITRIRPQDVDAISKILHDDFQRCSGFIVHKDEEAARQAVDGALTSQLLGSPINYLIDRPDLVPDLQAQVVALNIQNTIQTLSENYNNRYYNHPSGAASATWIHDLWQSYVTAAERDDVTVEFYDHSWQQPSVVLTIPGAWNADEIVVLGGHQDSIASGTGNPDFVAPGADDNASGIAALSEAIRVLMANDFQPQRTVKFMAYAAEEVGLLGSEELASRAVIDGDNVVAVMQLDMTAFNGSTEDVALLSDFTNPQLTAFVEDLLDTYQPELLWTSTACGYGCSDHASWHNRGFPATMPFEARFGQHNGAIHSTQDTLATLGNSAAHSLKFSRLATAFAVEIGLDDLGEMFRDGFETGDLTRWADATGSETAEP